MKPYHPFPNLYKKENKRKIKLFVKSHQTTSLFEEDIIKTKEGNFRQFDPYRSKLAAGITKGISQIGFKQGSSVLYLGSSHGYTPSFVSDMIGEQGILFGVDFAYRVVRDFVMTCEVKTNMIPIFASAIHPKEFAHQVYPCDVVFMDIAQKRQDKIFLENCKYFLKPGGFGLLAVKSRSMDITKKPRQIYQEVRKNLEQEMTVVDYKVLDPFEKDHCMFVCKKK